MKTIAEQTTSRRAIPWLKRMDILPMRKMTDCTWSHKDNQKAAHWNKHARAVRRDKENSQVDKNKFDEIRYLFRARTKTLLRQTQSDQYTEEADQYTKEARMTRFWKSIHILCSLWKS